MTRAVVRWGLACALLVWVAAPAWPEVVDDVYISAAYAHEWVEHGRLQWTTGEVVEGYSNLLMVAAMAGLVWLDLDVGLWAQILAMGCGAGVLALLSALLPRGAGGSLALLAVAGWAPLAWWSAQGMETTLYALLLSLAWVGAIRGGAATGWGVLAACLASLTRPEGAAHLLAVLAMGLRAWGGPWSMPAPALAGLLGLVGTHVLRVQHFGELWPTSALVKVAGVPWGLHGLAQLGGDLVSLAGPAVAVGAALVWRSQRRVLLALAPLAIQALVLVRASGDWMTWGRLTLPGALASLVALAVLLPPARPTPLRALLGGLGLLAGVVLAPVGYGRFDLDLRAPPTWARVREAWTHGLYTPVADDVAFAAWHLAEGASLATDRPGLLSHLSGIHLVRSADENVDWRRVVGLAGAPPSVPDGFHSLATVEYTTRTSTWRADTEARAGAALASTRLKEVYRRFPSHPELAREAAVALSAAGRLEEASAIARRAGRRWPHEALLAAAPESLFFVGGTAPRTWVEGRGFGLFWSAELWSRPLTAVELAGAVVHLDQDAAGAQPARVRLSLLGACEGSAEVDVGGPLSLPLSSLGGGGSAGPGELRVAFLNDAVEDGADRNVYVWVEAGDEV